MLRHIPFYASLLGRELADGTKTTTSHVLVYGAIEAHAMGSKGCIASNARIAEETGLKPSTVAPVISKLHKAGWIEVQLGKNNQRLGITPLLSINTPLLHNKPPLQDNKGPLVVQQTENTVREDSREDTTNVVSASERKPSQPYELVQHVIAIQGIKPFPVMIMQLAAAKKILESGYSLDEAKAAADRMQADAYWKSNPWDLNNLARNITKYSVDRNPSGFVPPKVIVIPEEDTKLTEEEYYQKYPHLRPNPERK